VKPFKKALSILSPAFMVGKSLLGGKGGGAAPDLPEVAAMPTANDAAAKAARRRRMLMNQSRSGRQSTMLSTTDTLG